MPKIPEIALIHEMAKQYNVLPSVIKQMPWSDWKELLEMRSIQVSTKRGGTS